MLIFKNVKLEFILIFFLQLNFISSEETIELMTSNCKGILLDGVIIYISGLKDNFNIYYNSNNQFSTKYSNKIINNKQIVKVDDSKIFVIFGINNNKQISYEAFSYANNNIYSTYNSGTREIGSNVEDSVWYNVTCHSKDSNGFCILSFISNNAFKIFYIDLTNANNNKEIQIPSSFISKSETKKNIQCDFSKDGDSIMCIFGWQVSENNYENKYWIRKLSSDGGVSDEGNICVGDCLLGNIAKVSDEDNSYLICYEKKTYKDSDSQTLSIICQYYTLKSNGVIIDDKYEIGQITINDIYQKPLKVIVYENTIMVQFNFRILLNSVGALIISSLDFKINVKSLINNNAPVENFLNDETSYLSFYEDIDKTKIKKESFVQCISDKFKMLSQEYVSVKFEENHSGQNIGFSLNKSTKLFKGDEIVSMTGNNFIEIINSNMNFNFRKIEENGKFSNYYFYAGDFSSGYYQKFSLICQIDIIICFQSCKSCNHEKSISSKEQYCLECNSGYYPIDTEINTVEGNNCYTKEDSEVSNYYLDTSANAFKICDTTCKTCSDANSCDSCKEDYYFKANRNDVIQHNEKCFNLLPDSHFFYFGVKVKDKNGNEITQSVYEPCYDTCLSCYSKGSQKANACSKCKNDLKLYDFGGYQCTRDTDKCLEDKSFWTFNDNNEITCTKKCSNYIIYEGKSKGQCVENCQNFKSPYPNLQTSFLLRYDCGKKYCLSYSTCSKGKFKIINDNTECVRTTDPCVEIDIFSNEDPFAHDNDPVPPGGDPTSIEDKLIEINKRVKIIKMFSDFDKSYSVVLDDFQSNDNSLIVEYNNRLVKELSIYDQESKVFLITTTKYNNFTITIYPLDIEDFAYEQVLKPNKLGFVNFTKIYSNYLNYEITKGRLILVALLEYNRANSAINDLNYFLFSFYENNNVVNTGLTSGLGTKISLGEDNDLTKSEEKVEILYPLSNYYNEASLLSSRNKENLTDNIYNMYLHYPDVELSNISDPFYNDICNTFKTDVDTDMTLNDRRDEYYIAASLCEDGCEIVKISNKESNEPASLCKCNLKYEVSFNENYGVKDNVPSISYSNAKSIKCISETFNKNSISSNVIFWIFLIVILFLIIMLIRYVFYGNKVVRRVIGLYDPNIDNSNVSISIYDQNGDNNNNPKKNSKGTKDKNNNISKGDKKGKLSKSNALADKTNKIKRYSNNQIEYQQLEYKSAPVELHAPPKKKNTFKNNSTKGEDENDLISNSEPSLFKGSLINGNEKNQTNTEISFENYPYDDPIYINNLMKRREMFENNYLKYPKELEQFQKMEYLRNALYPVSKIEHKRYFPTSEDIYDHNFNSSNFNGDENKNGYKSPKNKRKKNKRITKLLDGEDLFNKDGQIISKNKNGNLSDNNDEKKFEDNKEKERDPNNQFIFNEEKAIKGDEQFPVKGGLFGKDSGNLLIDENKELLKNYGKSKDYKKRNKNNKNEDNKERDDYDSDNDDNDDNDDNNEIISNDDNDENNKYKTNYKNLKKNKNNSKKKGNKKGDKDKDKDKKLKDEDTRKKQARNRLMKNIGKNNFYDDEEEKDGKEYEKFRTEIDMDEKERIKSELRRLANGEDNPNVSNAIFNKFRNKKNNNNDNNRYNKIGNDNNSKNSKNNKNNNFNSQNLKGNNLIKSNNPMNNSNLLKLKSKGYMSHKNNKVKNDSYKEPDSNRRILDVQEEAENFGDMVAQNHFEGDLLKKTNQNLKNSSRNNNNDNHNNSIDNINNNKNINNNSHNNSNNINNNSHNNSNNINNNSYNSNNNNKINEISDILKNSSADNNIISLNNKNDSNLNNKNKSINNNMNKSSIVNLTNNSKKNNNNKYNKNNNNKINKSKEDSKIINDNDNDNKLKSSVSSFLETIDSQKILVEDNFILYYWRYFIKREICFVSFRDKRDSIPYFVRWSCFAFCLIFNFLISCFFIFESTIHKRYLNALEGKKNSIVYYFKNEFKYSICVSLITCVLKMLIIKLVLYKLFKVSSKTKRMMNPEAEKGLNQEELEELQSKRNKYLSLYKLKLIIFFVLLMVLSIFFAYICICYGGVFANSLSAFLYGFLFSFIMSFIICAFICLIIVLIYRIAKCLNSQCVECIYHVLSIIY